MNSADGGHLARIVAEVHARLAVVTDGEVADYIPALALMPPDLFGIAVATMQGEVIEAGDTRRPFTIQSVSKPFAYAVALEVLGRERVRQAVGVQPMAEAFNALVLEPRRNRPYNAMVNAGAIAVAGLLRQHFGPAAFDELTARLSDAAGRPLAVDQAVYESEAATGHRNRALAHLLHAAGIFTVPADEAADLYFRQCSLSVTARDVAMMGATLAHIGANPRTGQAVFGLDAVRDTLSVMFSCGLYDGAGEWICRVGVPAKSGVGGGLVAVVNRLLGIGVFSPRVDGAGNPVRGLLACEHLSEDLGLHLFESSNPGSRLLPLLAR
ncbi:glutaminase A [Falsiroseomonas sp. HW251]|uniref:glutaminase A n=1 Tax=Falsiroseomonas sp. HW251 TaxID=3390998 RepID=UPI003D3172E7